jgi:hypothetical protein
MPCSVASSAVAAADISPSAGRLIQHISIVVWELISAEADIASVDNCFGGGRSQHGILRVQIFVRIELTGIHDGESSMLCPCCDGGRQIW